MNTYGRIYQNLQTKKLLRLKTFFFTCSFPIFVKNLSRVYNISCNILGKKLTNKFIKFTYGDIFLAGESTIELEYCLKDLKKEGLIGIADYAREFLTIEEEKLEIEGIIQKYKESIDSSIKVDPSNSIAMKVSSFTNVDELKRLNYLQYLLNIIEDGLREGKSYEDLLREFQNKKINNFTINEQFVNKIKNEINNKHFKLNLFEIILTEDINLIQLVKETLHLNESQLDELKNSIVKLNSRLLSVFNHAKNNNCLLMVDAEQSYLRFITDNIVAYYFKQFNKEKCILAQTLQCYLKTQQADLHKWKAFCEEHKLKFGLKLVRGAYMTEEAKIAKMNGTDSPVVSCIEDTHSNYDKSIKFLFDKYQDGDKFCIATHNLDSITLTGEMYKTKGYNENIFCAQLLGIAEHATGISRKHNIRVAKYVPFGDFDILIPYLIRRAEESSMIQKLKVQNDLLNEELYLRFAFWKTKTKKI